MERVPTPARPVPERGRVRWALPLVLALGIFAAITWWQRPVTSIKRMLAPQTSHIDIFLPGVDGGWKRVRRPAATVASIPDRVREIVQSLGQAGDDASVYAPLPETFPLRAVFLEQDRLYIDLAQPAVTEMSGGLEEERIMLAGLSFALGSNLPSVRQMQILVEGMPQLTLGPAGPDAGHLSITRPFRVVPGPS